MTISSSGHTDAVQRDSVLHVAHGALVAGRLRQLGYRHVHALSDNLAAGPVAVEVARTSELRRGYWASRGFDASVLDDCVDDLDCLDAPARAKVLWAAASWPARLACWRLLHAIAIGERGSPWRLARWAKSERSEAEASAYEHLGRDRVRAQLRAAVAVGADRLEAAARLWTAYASPTPEAVATLPWQDFAAFPAARASFGAYADALPRRGRSPGVVLVSRNDALLLSAVSSATWQRPVDLLRADAESSALLGLMTRYGDDFMIARWHAFAASSCGALALRPVAGINPWTDCELRRTRVGEALLADGTRDPTELPALHVGGTVAYRHPLWLCGEADGTWSLEPA